MGGLITLGLQIAADSSQVGTAVKQAEQAADELKDKTKDSTDEMEKGVLNSREAVRLLAEDFGIRLPRAVTSAISKIQGLQGALKTAGEVAITFFAAREMADALANWDKFRDKVSQLGAPFAELIVKTANLVGLMEDYSAAVRQAAEEQQQQVSQELSLTDRIGKGYEDLKIMRLSGVAKVREETNANVLALERENAAQGNRNRSLYDTLINLERLKGSERERQELAKEGEEAERKRERQTEEANKSAIRLAEAENRLRADVAGEITKLSIELDNEDTPALARFYERLQQINDQFGETPLAMSIVGLELEKLRREFDKTEAQWRQEQQDQLGSIKAEDQAGLESRGMGILERSADKLFTSAQRAREEFVKMHTQLRLLQPEFTELHPAFQAVTTDLQNLSNWSQVSFMQMAQGMTRATMAAAIYGENVGKAMEQAAKAAIASIAEQAAINALYAAAQGIWFLAQSIFFGDPNAAAAAAADFEAAAEWGAIAGVAGTAAAAIPSSASRGSQTGSGASGRYGAGSGSSSPQTAGYGMAPAAVRQPCGNLTVLVMGEASAGQWLATTLNTAVQRGVPLNATTVQKSPYAAG